MNEKDSSKLLNVFEKTETIHGLKYIADKTSSKPIRIFWILSFLLSICCFGYYAHKMYVKLYVEPEIGLRISEVPAMSVPYPAVTVCYEPKVRKLWKS
jgi:quinol-cytochrome oxidoreductase complex cytochrome b subunit